MATKLEGDFSVSGRLTCATFSPPAGCIADAAIPSGADINDQKVRHQHRGHFSQVSGTAATSATQAIHLARNSGTLLDFNAGSIVACSGAATIVVDLKKNGTTVLSSTITLDNANTARVSEAGTVNPASVAYVAGDLFEVVTTATAGGGTLGQGVFAAATFAEKPAP